MITREAAILGGAGVGLVVLAFALSVGLCAIARRWAPRLGLMDIPAGHKGHKAPTPLGGGVAIWLTTIIVVGLGAALAVLGRGALPPALARPVGGLGDRAAAVGATVGLA